MKKIITSVVLLLIISFSFAGPGDTTFVQTFEFEGYPIGDGWLSSRDGIFDFTEVEGLEFEKILAYYTLKCDPSQSPECGEWDYISYLQLREHTYTGEYPNFKLYGYKGGTSNLVSYMNTPSWKYQSRFEQIINYNDPNDLDEFTIGIGTEIINNPFDAETKDKRTMFLWRASEISTSGLSAGDITGMQFNISTLGSKMNRLNIRLKSTSLTELNSVIDTTGFTTVYSKNTVFSSTGWQDIDFTTFFNWDGSSNVIVDFYFSGEENGTSYSLLGNTETWNCGIETSDDKSVNFNNHDLIHAPVSNLSNITDQITISFWAKGDSEIQPNNNSIFEARDSEGNRILNIHHPWGDGTIYWDAGNENGYDRIEKATENPEMYKGEWHHWTYTKNASTDSMKIYFDGEIWHNEKWKFKELGNIDTLLIGKGIWNANGNYYAGSIDEFQIWDIELNKAEIQEWMSKEIDVNHPNYSNLKLYYKFKEDNQHTFYEEISETYSASQGVPQLTDFDGVRFKNFSTQNIRPNIKFNRNNSNYSINNELVIDSFPKGQNMIITYEQLVPDVKPTLDEVLYKWPIYETYTYDANGNPLDTTEIPADVTIHENMFIYSTTNINEELTIPWELGRFITPYGNGLSLGEGWTWVFDVTKFQNFLVGNDVYLKAGNFQELLNLKFAFIEGTPARDFIDIEKVWSGNFQLNDFDNIVEATTIPLNPSGEIFELHTTLTGHWFGQGNNCAEFCSNIHSVNVNGTEQYSWQIIQECGLNPLFPQGGTWIYDRAGWCPGMPATMQKLNITPYIGATDTEVELDYNIEHDPYGNYVTETFFVTYGGYNFENDAAIDDIIAPNTNNLNTRYNPICGQPIIKIKNNGSEALTSINIAYGINNQNSYNYSWTGNLAFGETEDIYLPSLNFEEFEESATNTFTVTLSNTNGVTDEYEYNNTKISTFETVPIYNNQIEIRYKPNSRYWESSYEIINHSGTVVHSKTEFSNSDEYVDVLTLPYGCYEFVAYDTGGDGMYNWPSNHGNGYIKFYDTDGNSLKTLENWFGEEIRHKFVYSDYIGVEENKITVDDIFIFPNPANDILNIKFKGKNRKDAIIRIQDIAGKIVIEDKINNIEINKTYQVKVNSVNSGIYFINVISNGITIVQKIIIK